jgi:hypothetical protein
LFMTTEFMVLWSLWKCAYTKWGDVGQRIVSRCRTFAGCKAAELYSEVLHNF